MKGNKMIIIAVDDEKMALENLVSQIAKEVKDAEIHGFRKPTEALEFAGKTTCEIAFLDIEMRGMNGIELAKRLKMITPKINIVFTSGYSEYMGSAFEMHASGYILKPITAEKIRQEMQELRYPIQMPEEKRMQVKTFGNFEVFVDNTPLKFQYSKTKELLAYLIDRNGALCNNGEIISVLWEEDLERKNHYSYLKNLRVDLVATLESVGCGECLIKQRGKLGIVPDKIQCDYFDWIRGKAYAINAYRGEYMNQYSWSEFTHALLDNSD